MKKLFLLTKTLLAVALLCVGQNAWGAAALTKSLKVTGYEAVNLFDFQNKDYDGTALANFEALSDLGVTAQCTIQTAYGTNNWYDDTAGNHGLRLQSGGGRWIQFTVDVKKDDYIIINGGAASEAYEISMTNGESVSVSEASDYLCFKATQDAASLKLTVHRYNYLLQILIMTKDGSAETADYTINYKASGETVKTVSGNEAVGTVIPVLNSFFEGGKKYVTDGGQASSLTIAEGDNNLDITVTEAAQYTCTVNAKAGETLLASPSGTVYSGENAKVFYKKAYKNGGTWYMTPANGSYPSYAHTFSAVSANSNYDVTTYSAAENVVYFGEVEEMNLSGSFAADGGQPDRYSNGVAKRLYSKGGATPSGGSWVYTDDIPAGVYTVTMWARNQSGSQTATLPVYLRDSEGNMTDLSTSFEAWGKSAQGEKSVEITIPNDGKTYSVAIYNYSGYNSNLEMDYVYVTFVRPLSVSKTITSAGYATYCSQYALNFSGIDGLKAYKVTGTESGSTLALETVTTVPANTGVLLEGTAGTYNIPVIAGADAITGNKLVGVLENTDKEAESIYVLMDETAGVGFYKNKNAFKVGANTAYLPANFAEVTGDARSAYFFRGDITGVDNVEAAAEAKAQDGKFIENGKLVIVKNGQKFNAAGAQVK